MFFGCNSFNQDLGDLSVIGGYKMSSAFHRVIINSTNVSKRQTELITCTRWWTSVDRCRAMQIQPEDECAVGSKKIESFFKPGGKPGFSGRPKGSGNKKKKKYRPAT